MDMFSSYFASFGDLVLFSGLIPVPFGLLVLNCKHEMSEASKIQKNKSLAQEHEACKT